MNFLEFEELINSGAKEIALTEDVVFDDESEYLKGINLDIDDFVIDGNYHIIDANEKSSIFVVSGKNIMIKNIILKNGYSQDFFGAIINYSDNLAIECCKFFNNCSDDLGNAFGGAIFNKDGKINIKDSVFKENQSDYGGAIYNDSILNINNSIFDSNSSEFEGGAIYNRGELMIKNSLFDKNAAFKGGAIYNENILNVKDCKFKDNIASDGNHIESDDDENLSIADCAFD